MFARVIVAAILFMTLAHQIASQTAPISSTTSLNATHGVDSNITFTPTAGALPQAVYYQVSWNVSDATSVNVTVDIYVNDARRSTAKSTQSTENPAELVSETSGLLNPCLSSVSEKDSVIVNIAAVTNGPSGEAVLTSGTVDVPAIKNDTAFDLKCAVQTILGESCVSYYTTEVTVAEGETWSLYAQATSAADVAIGTTGACPSVYQTLGATTSTALLSNVTSNLTLWVAVNATSSLAMPQLTFTWMPLVLPPPVAPNAPNAVHVPEAPLSPPTAQPEQSPVTDVPAAHEPATPESGPVSAPSGDNKDLPQWALALLVVFGLLIGVLLIVVIVLCVKNRRRASYNTVA